MNLRVCLTFIFFSLLFIFNVYGQTIERGPYLQSVTTESIYINWRTDLPTDGKVWYGDSPSNLNFSIFLEDSLINHEVLIDGLSSNTTYFYAVGNGSGQIVGGDSSHYFKTSPLPNTTQTIRAWVLGDAGTANTNQRNVRDAFYNYNGINHTDMILLLGDNAYQDGTDNEYQLSWFENMYEDKLIQSVVWPSFGNHDGRSSTSSTQTGPYYDIFNVPKNGESGGIPSGTEAYYSFDYGNIHVVSLNSDDIDRSPNGEMMQWLEDDLNASNKDWKVVIFHHSPYTGENNNESDVTQRASEMRENAIPIIEAAGVDLVLCGHTHAYQRSFLINGHYGVSSTWDPDSMGVDLGNGRTDGDGPYLKNIGTPEGNLGTVYVVAGSSGKMDNDNYNHPVMAHNAEKLGSVVLEINELQMDVKFIDSDSLVEDYFTIIKQGDPPSVNITNPLNNDYYDDPQNITLTADASDNNGYVTQVEFLVDNVSIGIDDSAPYSIDWTPPGDGLYQIKALATDDENQIAFSVVNIQVGPSMICNSINSGSDDAEEKANGNVSTTSSDLELILDGTNQTVGLRFVNLNIPQCAVITEAYVQFTVDETNNVNPCTIQIFGEASDNATSFSNATNEITSRPKTQISVEWSPDDWLNIGDNGPAQKTVDIAPVVQEIVDREGFTPNSSIVILMEGTGKRVAESYNGSSALAPEICVEFIPYGPDDDNDGTCNANDLCPGIPEPGTPCNDNDPGTYNDVIDSNCNCVGIPFDCPSFPANIGDLCDDGNPGTYNDEVDSLCNCIGILYDCPSIQADIGDICDDGDSGTYNDVIDSNCNCVGIPYDCPVLMVNFGDPCDDNDPNTALDSIDENCNCVGTFFECPNVPGNIGDPCDDGNPNSVNDVIDSLCVCLGTISTNASVSHKNDDAEENPNGTVSLTSSDLEIVKDGNNDQVIGIRFNNLDIPKDAQIESAYIQFTVDQTDNFNPSILEIFGEASDDATIFTSSNNDISNRTKTVASILWSPVDWTSVGENGPDQQTPDISNIIQEIVERDGYTSNSSIAVIIEGVGKRTAVSYDGDSNDAPEIFVTFKCKDNNNDGICDLCPGGFEPGAPCDDGNPETYNDTIDFNCDCIGIPYDCPSIPGNIGDACDDGNPETYNDLITSNCECLGSYDCPSIQANIGDPCDDGDPNTSNDVIDNNCNCVGSAYDCPSIPANIGDPCDDGNPETSNDIITSNCTCEGSYDCPSIQANIGDPCDDGNPETSNDIITSNCTCEGSYDCPSIQANIGDPCDDGDPGTYNDVVDSNCNCVGIPYDCPSIPANIGDPCDDGNPNTPNDVITPNCICMGTYDCPSIPANIGDPCDDGDPGTHDDMVDSNCNCVGIPYDCPAIPADYGDPCDDGNPETSNDIITSNCTCEGSYDCPSIQANIGDPCDDGNPETSNDVITSNCECLGSYDCPSISANIGDTCDDGDPGTYNDIVDANCNCVGIPYDCPSIPGNIGDPCDDGNPNSTNDVIDNNCFCLGSITAISQIDAGSDDAEEKLNGSVNTTSSDIEMIIDGSTDQTIGLRFTNLNIPQGAQIEFAFIQFTADQTDNINPSNIDIFGEANDNAPTFENSTFNISSRQKTIESVTWSPANWASVGDSGPDQQTDNIAAIIQEIVDRPGYTENSAIAIIIEGEGKRTAESLEGDPGAAAEIMIIYKCSDENNDGICDLCPGGPQPGESCDDGNPGTYNDIIDSNCNCIGIPYDCPSIQANIGDSCDDGNPETSNDIITSNCICEGSYDCPSIPANIGDPCDDGNPETSNDVITPNCECLGVYDCPSFPANIGDSCDDGDPGTYNDIIDSNCDCIGIPFDCPSIQANFGDSCDDGNPATSNDIITSNCICEGSYDCPSFPANIGDPCDDGNPETSNDVITPNCECLGVYDCPSIQANIGDSCDDGNPETYNDIIDSNCNCVGSPFECPNIPGNIGDPCDDGDPNTSNDVIDANCECLGSSTITVSVNQSSDDAEENLSGNVDLTSSDLELIIDGSDDQIIGIRFNNLNIPQGATIENAFIQFTADQTDNINPCELTIYGEAVDNASTFSSVSGNISNRTKTIASVSWSPANWTNVGEGGLDEQTYDISSIIQEIVDRNGFTTSSSIVIIIEGNGKRTAESFDGDPNGVPELVVTFKCNDSNNDGYCDECPGGVAPGDPCDDENPETYNDLIDSNCDCSGIPYDCPSIPANIGDVCDDGDPETHSDLINSNCVCEGILYDCPTILANFGDACDDGDPNTVNDEIDQNCDCTGYPLVSNLSCGSINSSSDDAEEKANGNINLTSSDLEMIIDGSTTQTIGLRFTNLNIPKGAIISNADIQFVVDQTDNVNPCTLEIYGEASDDASTFSSNYDISTRVKTSASETWTPADWQNVGDAGPDQKTVDFSSVIQEIVNRSGYSSSNAIVIIIEGVGKRTAESFNASPGLAPEICVEYFDPPQSIGINPNGSNHESEVEQENLNLNLGVENQVSYSSIKIFPNPATEKLIVAFESFEEGLINIQIMDLSGRKLIVEKRNVHLGNNAILLDRLDLESGIYFIRTQFGDSIYTSKFTILK